jgi:Na+-driven multidrug efflux pump
MPAVFVTGTAKNFCEALARPWPPFWIMLGGVLLNVLLNWILIYGHLGAPAMGLDGAGLATLLSRIATLAALATHLASDLRLTRAGRGRLVLVPPGTARSGGDADNGDHDVEGFLGHEDCLKNSL